MTTTIRPSEARIAMPRLVSLRRFRVVEAFRREALAFVMFGMWLFCSAKGTQKSKIVSGGLAESGKRFTFVPWVSLVRPAPAESPRAGRQQG